MSPRRASGPAGSALWALVYGAGAATWVFAYVNVDATWHELAAFVAIVVWTGLVAAVVGSWWCVLLPFFPLVLSLAAGDAGGEPAGDFNTAFDFTLIALPFSIAAAAAGVAARRAASRARPA